MPFKKETFKAMQDDTLQYIALKDEANVDYKVLSEFLKKTNTLQELDLACQWKALKDVSEGLKQNRSVTLLGLGEVLRDEEVPLLTEVLTANPGISMLKLDNAPLEFGGLRALGEHLKKNQGITHLTLDGVNKDEETGAPQIDFVVNALKRSPNVIDFAPATPEMEEICAENKRAAILLLTQSAESGPHSMTRDDLDAFKTRLPAIVSLAEHELEKVAVCTHLLNIQYRAEMLGMEFPLPHNYQALAATLPLPFVAAEETVDFSQNPDRTQYYKAVAAGQVDELMEYLGGKNQKLTAADCLAQPEGKAENLIELVARQGKLASVITMDNWASDPRGLRQAVQSIRHKSEWDRQTNGTPLEAVIFQVNAASFQAEPEATSGDVRQK